jgi:hypothetical protein
MLYESLKDPKRKEENKVLGDVLSGHYTNLKKTY